MTCESIEYITIVFQNISIKNFFSQQLQNYFEWSSQRNQKIYFDKTSHFVHKKNNDKNYLC